MKDKVLLIGAEGLGRGDDRLGGLIMGNLLRLLAEDGDEPSIICLWNGGVRLACEGSPVLDHLKVLESRGTKILSCRTCLEYFDLTGHVRVGIISTMKEIKSLLMNREVVSV